MSFHHNTIEKKHKSSTSIGMSRRDIAEKEEIIRWQENIKTLLHAKSSKKKMSEPERPTPTLTEISAGDGLLTKSLRELGWSLIGVNNNAASSSSYYFEQAVPAYENNELLFQIVTLICLF